ncbi:MAG: RNA methyltransferase [Ruminococcaceae bacterium]|nr:RNA methyltransferase [Oscillospiraceae bacterium]
MDKKQIITSRQNPLVKSICALSDKKRRAESGLFRIDGKKLLEEAISSGISIKYVVLREGCDDSVLELASRARADIVSVSESVFEKMSDERSPEGVITVAYMPSALHTTDARVYENESILIAQALRDPGNLGTVIRSAYALGIDKLVLTSDCADLYNPKTQRAAMGAIFKLPTVSIPADGIEDFIRELIKSGRRVYATALHADARDISELDMRSGDCFVIGNEGHGLRSSTVDVCTAPVVIPMREGAESLNAAAAAAICIWETVRNKSK